MHHSVNEDDLEGIIFDCDGTLVDTMPAFWYAWNKTCEVHGLHLTEKRFYELAGVPVQDMIQMLIDEAGKAKTLSWEEVGRTKDAFNKEGIRVIGTPLIDCVVEIARAYRGKKPMAVASSGLREEVVQSLKSNGILELFDVVVTREDVIHPKPAPDIYLKAAALIKCDPTKCRGYEDGEVGMQALIAAGIAPFYVKSFKGYPRTNEL